MPRIFTKRIIANQKKACYVESLFSFSMRSFINMAGLVALSNCTVFPDHSMEAPMTQRKECLSAVQTAEEYLSRSIEAMKIPACIRARIDLVMASKALADAEQCGDDPAIRKRIELTLAGLVFVDITLDNACPDRYGF